jgi:hypothetical protein
MITVEGYIYNKKGELINNATLQVVNVTTGVPIVAAVTLPAASYSAWTDKDPNMYGVLFKKSGYAPLTISFAQLSINPDIILESSSPLWAIGLVIAAVLLYRKKTGKVGKLSTGDLLPIFLLVGGVLGFSLIKKILEGLGIWDSKDTKQLDADSGNPNSWWNPLYWQNKPANVEYTSPITEATARTYAKQIYDAFGIFNDNEEQVISVFRHLPSKAAGSFLAWVFAKQYNEDLLTFLRGGWWPQDRLSDADVNTINNYVNRLPAY